MIIEQALAKEILIYLSSRTDEELCGLVVESGGAYRFLQCENNHQSKVDNFKINPNDYIKASTMGKVAAVCHSHNESGLNHLSSNDRISQYLNPIDWILVKNGDLHPAISLWTAIPKLKGREFSEGYSDCYDSFRDFYRLAGIEMGEYGPSEGMRIPDWYKKEGASSPFLENIESEGFYQIKSSSLLEPGDVILSLLGAKVPNHASVYVGDNQIFHHLPGKLSACEPMKSFYMKYAHSFWRHKDRDNLNISAVIDILNRG